MLSEALHHQPRLVALKVASLITLDLEHPPVLQKIHTLRLLGQLVDTKLTQAPHLIICCLPP
jgi:hypothetical protein